VLRYARDRAATDDAKEAPGRLTRLRDAFNGRQSRPSGLAGALALAETGQLAEAITRARDEMFLARDNDDPLAQAQANAVLADLYAELGYIADAREAIDLVTVGDDPRSKALAYRVRGKIAYRQRRLSDAKTDFERALELVSEVDAPLEVARILGERAIGCAKAQHYAEAHIDADRAVQICEATGTRDPLPAFRSVHAKATVCLYEGKAEQARLLLDRVRPLLGAEHVLSMAWLLQAAARIELAADSDKDAIANARDGLELFVGMSHRYGEAHCRFALGQAFVKRDRHDLAIGEFREALAIFRDSGGDWIEGRISLALADCHRHNGDDDTADRLEAQATEIFAALGDGDLAAVLAAHGHALRGRRRHINLDSVNY
jgi:tetratricopeptide (TPR) repeat protein